MRRLVRLAARLYPPAWRARYGAEFDALLEDAGAGWSVLGDVLKGAIIMQFTRWNFARILALCGAVGIVAGAAIAFHLEDSYVSTAVLSRARGAMPAAGFQRVAGQVLSDQSLAGIIQKFGLYPEERRKMPLAEVAQSMKKYITIVPARGREAGPLEDAIVISFSYPDPAKAQAVTRELTNRLTAGGAPVVTLSMLDAASLPNRPFSPNRPAWILAGLLIGLAAGALWVGIRRRPIVVLAGAAGMLLAGIIAFAIPNSWNAIAIVTVTPPEAASQVAAFVRQTGRGMRVQQLENRPGTLALESTGRGRFEPQAAVRQFNAIVRSSPAQVTSIHVLNSALLRQSPKAPQRLAILFAGLLAGLLLGAFWRRSAPTALSSLRPDADGRHRRTSFEARRQSPVALRLRS
ncbi:MAG TPA: hypothetical protein VME43_23305 [Bryobacteraceae bacterium]|nr:hypothetical protein [Bryobacteraceae bacterium]